MTRQSEYESRIERLRVVVSAYGGDPSRWPAQDRDELLDLVDTNPEAMAIVRDGQQFDQLLDVANVADVRSEAETDFADRIFAAVTAEENIKPLLPQQETPADNVIDFASRRKTSSQDHAADEEIVSRAGWLSAAALAASLVLGVLLGANGYVESATTGISGIAGLSVQTDSLQLEDGFGPVEEDYL